MTQPSSPFLIAPGVLLAGKYRLQALLGEGAMGSVWKALNESTSREVAVKLIARPEQEFRVRLMREARALGALKHKNVIDIYDIEQTDTGDPFLVMQLLHGETVAELLARKRRLDPPEAARIARDIARALSAAHAVQIIHRDLKPANIFLHKDPHEDGPAVIKVLDFGVAKNLAVSDGLHTAVGGTVGSPLYMSPEQVKAERDVDARADLWALGVVLFEMIAGQRPFDGDATQVFTKILASPIPSLDRYVRHIEPGLVAVVDRCLQRDRAKRWTSATDIAAALDPYVARTEKTSGTWPNPTLGQPSTSPSAGSGQYPAASASGPYPAAS
ncbi:MAG TPA: serine/threonine-protein kinase, partial [Candidatus Nanopelagicales bacterium]|nr:serine/threonine-protein kinase [Candidatus Nanopelagicales bacterium]